MAFWDSVVAGAIKEHAVLIGLGIEYIKRLGIIRNFELKSLGSTKVDINILDVWSQKWSWPNSLMN